jgi:hypothetical protein
MCVGYILTSSLIRTVYQCANSDPHPSEKPDSGPHRREKPDPGTSYKSDLDLDPHQSGNSDPDSDLRRESRIRNIWLQIRNTTVPVQYL